jgi:hypothetical protein
MMLFLDKTGPLLQYNDGTLMISDLNPEMQVNWRISRIEMWRLGWRCIMAASWELRTDARSRAKND